MDFNKLEKTCNKEIIEGKGTLVTTRICQKPDLAGVKKILKEHPNIHIIALENSFLGTIEKFYQLDNIELAKQARDFLEKEWLLE